MAGCGRLEKFRRALRERGLQRDTPAVRECQWQSVRQLVLQSCSLEQRDLSVRQAVTHSQWWLVSQLVQLGVSQQHRDLAVREASRYCLRDLVQELLAAGVDPEDRGDISATDVTDQQLWELIFTALHIGISQQPLSKMLREVGYPEDWEPVPSLAKLFINHDHTDFVLRAAVRCSQWSCVQRLIRTGLPVAQQLLVCTESLRWLSFECALELLRQGCDRGCAQRIVLEAFRWNRCQDLVGLFKEYGVTPSAREVIVKTASDHGFVDSFLLALMKTGATEKEMVEVITAALNGNNADSMLPILSSSPLARRVFKQLILKKQFPHEAILCLCTSLVKNHPDLAFCTFIVQEMWERAIGLLGDTRIGPKQRRFALENAIRKRAWKAVRTMVKSGSLRHSDRRYAFLQTARRGKWRLSLKLSTSSSRISVSDKLFALRTWLKRGLWNCVDHVYRQWVGMDGSELSWDDSDTTQQFLDCVMKEASIAGQLQPFLKGCSEQDWYDSDLESYFQTAVDNDHCSFVHGYCLDQTRTDDFMIALEVAIEKKKWNLLSDLLQDTYDCVESSSWDYEENLEANVLGLCLNGLSHEEACWEIVVPALDEFCGKLTQGDAGNNDFDSVIKSENENSVQRLAEWCLGHSFGNAALVLSVLSKATDIVSPVTHRLGNSIHSDVIRFCFEFSFDSEVACICLPCLSLDEAESAVYDLFNAGHADELAMVERFKEKQQYHWAVYISIWTEHWEQVKMDLPNCEGTSVVDYAIRKANSSDQWDFVQEYLNQSSQDPDLLSEILPHAVRVGEAGMCTTLLSQVDLLQSSVHTPRSLLHEAVTSSGDREDMLKLCIRFGLSTHAASCKCSEQGLCTNCSSSPLKTALRNGQMPLVKLLYQAGACSNRQLLLCQQDAGLRTQLQGQNRQDIVQYLDETATTPRTLQDLCRLQVSHLIGCHPGRQDRVRALGVTWPAENLITFQDVLS